MLEFQISQSDHCRQVESFLHNLLPVAPYSYVRKLANSGNVCVNGLTAELSSILCLDDIVTIKESGKTKSLLQSARPELDILYEDSWIVIFNKPAGLPMHRAAEVDGHNLVDLGARFMIRRDGGNGKLRPINRLDRGTSGAVLLAKSSTAAGMFGRHVKEEGLDKLYLAVVEGNLTGEGVINMPLEGKEAETRYKVLSGSPERTLVAVYPVTGRMHQIRLHLESIGHSICGDRRYGGSPFPELPGHALHSFRSAVDHPALGERIQVFAPLPGAFLQLVKMTVGEQYSAVLKKMSHLP